MAWVNPKSNVLSFLSKKSKSQSAPAKRSRPPRPRPPTDEDLAKATRQKEVDALDHEIDRKKREYEVARWRAKTQNAELGILDETTGEAILPDAYAERVESRLTEDAAEAAYGAEKVTRLRREASRIFLNVRMLKGEKRALLRALLDAYGVDARALPPAIQEILEEDDGYEPEES